MEANLEQLKQVAVFASLAPEQLKALQPYAAVFRYLTTEIVMHEGDHLPPCLHALVSGMVRITKTAATGKETILRVLGPGELFAAPALFGNGIAPATVTAETDCQVVTVERKAIINAIRDTPEIALSILSVFNQRLQQLHNTVHGLVSERAIARLAHYIQYFATEQGIEATAEGDQLRAKLSYYQIARSIGITYEECVRLFKQLQSVLLYRRGGTIIVKDWNRIAAIAAGDEE